MNTRVAGALDYIQGNLAGDLSLDRLAGRAGVSQYHFHRLFKAMVGEPPKKSCGDSGSSMLQSGSSTRIARSRTLRSRRATRRTAPRHTRCDAALSVEAGVASEGDIRVRALPGGNYAVVRHEGRYQAQALRRIYELVYGSWLPAIGREPADAPPFEVYKTPSQGPGFPSLVTSVHVPLAAGGT
ncbi:MAG: GyrI-like domain-containing protein [Myxococcota bacterium]